MLREQHEAAGAVWGGEEAPEHYGDPAAEEEALAVGVGLVDRSDVGVVELTGRDRATFLQGLVTNDVVGLPVGQACRAALLNVKARVQMLLEALALPERLRLVVAPGAAPALLAKLDSFLIMEQVEMADVTGHYVCLALEGPRAAALGAALGGVEVERFESGGAVQLWVPAERGEALWSAVLQAGADFGLRPVGRQAAEVARIRAGIPAWGTEATEETFLPDLPLDPLVSWTKGCYLGQEPVARVRYRGHPNRGLAGLVFEGHAPPPGTALRDSEREVGAITSAAFSHQLGRGIALAVIRREALQPDTRLELDGGGPARVVSLPIERPPAAEETS